MNIREISGSLASKSGTACNIVPDKAVAEIMATRPDQVAEACRDFAKETGYNLTASAGPANLSITSVGKAAHGSPPYKGVNAAMQLFAFLARLDLAKSDMSDAIRFIDAQINLETDGHSLGLAMEDEPSGNLTVNWDWSMPL